MVEDHRAAPGRRRTLRTGARAGRGAYRSILDVFDELAGRGVELRILHAGAAVARVPGSAGTQPAARRAR